MDYDHDKVDEMALALMFLSLSKSGGVSRAWKGFDWGTLDRMHRKGWISDPMTRSPSIDLTPGAAQLAEEVFRRHFGKI